ncbi:hypothetical protein DPMN_087691 [Dreissena polymorpha]|uniref:Uncharacterized protein n=1 Tax=Dreissena polymorpha TaxID=45954 RepID=A0A9D4KUR9_DREPO|nr:hypothetical protein DPMN_087691 [Dreissena polymorpha]
MNCALSSSDFSQLNRYYHFSSLKQVAIFRLGTWNNKLIHRMHKRFIFLHTLMCPDQMTEYILKESKDLYTLKENSSPEPVSRQEKLYGQVEAPP